MLLKQLKLAATAAASAGTAAVPAQGRHPAVAMRLILTTDSVLAFSVLFGAFAACIVRGQYMPALQHQLKTRTAR